MTISMELLDELLSGAELTEHLGYEPHGEPANHPAQWGDP